MANDRILYVITAADVGGAQAHVLDLVHGFRGRFDVHLATGEEGPLTRAARAAGAGVHVLASLVRPISPRADARGVAECFRLIRSLGPRLVHAHSSKAGLVARAAARAAGVPSVFTAHGWGFSRGVAPARRPIVWASELLAAPLGSHIICVSEDDRRAAAACGIARLAPTSVIYYGIPDAAPAAAPAAEPPAVAVVARFFPQKDHALLLRAFAAAGHPEARLLLAGDGPELAACRSLAADLGIAGRTEFLGARDDVPQILAGAQVFALASRYEGLPISILEAMRAGLPVVATANNGTPEAVAHGRTGLLAPPGDEQALAAALRLALGQPQLRSAMGHAGREAFLRSFTRERMLAQIASLYDTLAARAPSRIAA